MLFAQNELKRLFYHFGKRLEIYLIARYSGIICFGKEKKNKKRQLCTIAFILLNIRGFQAEVKIKQKFSVHESVLIVFQHKF